MKTNDRKTTAAEQKARHQVHVEKQAVKKFNSELQKAIDAVDWANVKLPKFQC